MELIKSKNKDGTIDIGLVGIIPLRYDGDSRTEYLTDRLVARFDEVFWVTYSPTEIVHSGVELGIINNNL